MTSYLIFVATVAGIYAMLSLGLVTIWGQGGMVNLGLVGFFAVGAYVSAILTENGLPIAFAWLASAVIAGAVGVALTFVTRKMRGDYLAIVSLGFAEVVRVIAMNEIWLTRGSDGISGIRAPLKLELGDWFSLFYLVLVWTIAGLTAFALTRLFRSPFGRALRAIRDDEQVAAVAGKPVLRFKLNAFFIGALVTGLAGAMYAHLTSFIAPDSFIPLLTIYIFLATTTGGYTRVKGAIIGAIFVVALLESTRFLAGAIPTLNAVQVASMREMVIALALIVIMRVKADGFCPSKIEKSGVVSCGGSDNDESKPNVVAVSVRDAA
ncbi:branched-chain amino acid transport system permease protein [Collimonas sp. OK307]|uniref:branched-chain amino acid ABC transporter permease n=1 Tax=Collimonas sp. OK307 TaxID=1801620 RepID=UPI0008EBBEF4|nr:branched-chain amino acid ABC transporter permease [Collimonas sp. OK307]SFH72121.1 branched-chain amino acid transport system permease protein [Collimonas sp. OK307]